MKEIPHSPNQTPLPAAAANLNDALISADRYAQVLSRGLELIGSPHAAEAHRHIDALAQYIGEASRELNAAKGSLVALLGVEGFTTTSSSLAITGDVLMPGQGLPIESGGDLRSIRYEIVTQEGIVFRPTSPEEQLREAAINILDPEFYDINMFTSDRLTKAGVTDVRSLYLVGQLGLTDGCVLNHSEVRRLIDDLKTKFPHLPELPPRAGDPIVAAQLYDSLDEMPANTVFGNFIRKFFGKSKRMTMQELANELAQENYTRKNPDKFDFEYNGLGGMACMHTRTQLEDFIEKFEEAKRKQANDK